jgi:hypothetical protein
MNLLKRKLLKSYPLKWNLLEEKNVPKNHEISIHYVSIGEIWDRNKIVVDNIFSFKVALNITRSNDVEFEPQIVEECRRRNDWPKWNSDRAKLMSKI